jgi:Fe-S cluster assembly ATP-binding protein
MLDIHCLTLSRGGEPVVRDFSLTLSTGECCVVTGSNGSGKSTLLLGIAGHPHVVAMTGSITFFSEDITGLPPETRFARGIFLTHQDPPELQGVTFEMVVRGMLPELAKDAGLFFAEMRKVLTEVGLTDAFIDKPLFVQCSGGEKKRLELALLLLARPRLALFDELDAGLDKDAQRFVLNTIARLRDVGTICVVVSHNEHFAAGITGAKRIDFV